MKFEICIRQKDRIEDFYRDAIAEYVKRLQRYCKAECLFIKKRKEWENYQKEDPAVRIFAVIPGKNSISSEMFARKIEEWENHSVKKVRFLIDSGEDQTDKKRDRTQVRTFAVSSFALPEAMTGMILSEQVYRAYRIIHHQPYHK